MKWQRCHFHLAKNLLDYIPPNISQEVASAELRGVFNAPNRAEADRLLELMVRKYQTVAPKLAAWLEENVPEGLTVFDVPVDKRWQTAFERAGVAPAAMMTSKRGMA